MSLLLPCALLDQKKTGGGTGRAHSSEKVLKSVWRARGSLKRHYCSISHNFWDKKRETAIVPAEATRECLAGLYIGVCLMGVRPDPMDSSFNSFKRSTSAKAISSHLVLPAAEPQLQHAGLTRVTDGHAVMTVMLVIRRRRTVIVSIISMFGLLWRL
jgi:hypothetical protein